MSGAPESLQPITLLALTLYIGVLYGNRGKIWGGVFVHNRLQGGVTIFRQGAQLTADQGATTRALSQSHVLTRFPGIRKSPTACLFSVNGTRPRSSVATLRRPARSAAAYRSGVTHLRHSSCDWKPAVRHSMWPSSLPSSTIASRRVAPSERSRAATASSSARPMP